MRSYFIDMFSCGISAIIRALMTSGVFEHNSRASLEGTKNSTYVEVREPLTDMLEVQIPEFGTRDPSLSDASSSVQASGMATTISMKQNINVADSWCAVGPR